MANHFMYNNKLHNKSALSGQPVGISCKSPQLFSDVFMRIWIIQVDIQICTLIKWKIVNKQRDCVTATVIACISSYINCMIKPTRFFSKLKLYLTLLFMSKWEQIRAKRPKPTSCPLPASKLICTFDYMLVAISALAQYKTLHAIMLATNR